MSGDLYEQCHHCGGTGWRRSATPSGRQQCFACDGIRFVKIGLTAGQVEKMAAENDRLKAADRAPLAIVIVHVPGFRAIELHSCDLPSSAIRVSQRLTAEGKTLHEIHNVKVYHRHRAEEEPST